MSFPDSGKKARALHLSDACWILDNLDGVAEDPLADSHDVNDAVLATPSRY